MKRFIVILIFLLVFFLFACGGSHSIPKSPEPLTIGMKETAKGITKYKKGCYKDSLEHFFRAHELFTATDHLSGVAMSLNNIGNVYRATGDSKSAVLFFNESFSIYTNMGENKEAVQVLSNKASAMIDDGMLKEATKVLNTAEDSAKKNDFLFVPLLNTRGILLIKKKEYTRAEEILQKALTDVDPENFSEYATVNFTLGNLMLETQRYEKAVDLFTLSLKADRASGFTKGVADDLAAIGLAYSHQKKDHLAVDFFKRSIKIYALMGNKKKVHETMKQLERVSEKTGFDLSVTNHFVNRWLEGKSFEKPCE